jgi:hypothetical protein
VRITLDEPFCGKSPGDEMSVSDSRGIHLMKEGIAKPDPEILKKAGVKLKSVKKGSKPKKEKATSKGAANREKATK